MKPLTLTLEGIGPHRSTSVDFSKLPSPIAVTAPRGTGKTWLVEGIFAALYGEFAWYPGSIYEALTQGGTGEGTITLLFEHAGKTYEVERTIKSRTKTKTQQAFLHLRKDYDVEMIAGPKVGDVDRAISAMLGDKEIALATWFLSQNRRHDMIGTPGEKDIVAFRRMVLGSLLGTAALDTIEKKLAALLSTDRHVTEELESQLAGEQDWVELTGTAQYDLGIANSSQFVTDVTLATVEGELEEARKRVRDSEAGDDILRGQIAEHASAKRALANAHTTVESTTNEVERLEKRAQGLDKAEQDEKRLADARAAIVPLQQTVTELRQKYNSARSINTERAAQNKAFDDRRGSITMEVNSLTERIQQLNTRLAKKPVTPGAPEVCAACPLLAEYVALPVAIQKWEWELYAQRDELADVPDNAPITDLSEIIAQGDAATVEVASKQREIDTLAGAPERVRSCREAAQDALDKRDALMVLQETVRQEQERADATESAAASAAEALANAEAQRSELTRAQNDAQKAFREAEKKAKEIAADITRRETNLENYKVRAGEAKDKRERVAKLREKIAGMADLRQCFGPKGVRQILADAATPDLEAIADDLFERATGGRMRLRIATQKVLADGSLAEDFGILVRDQCGERDARRFSGGELQLNRILFRVAQAIWIGQLHGRKPDCLCLDEAFDQLGIEGAEELFAVFDYLADQIGMLITVTHDGLIADRHRSQIRLKKHISGVAVTLQGERETT